MSTRFDWCRHSWLWVIMSMKYEVVRGVRAKVFFFPRLPRPLHFTVVLSITLDQSTLNYHGMETPERYWSGLYWDGIDQEAIGSIDRYQ